MPPTVQGLKKRIPNGAKLTPAQGDQNLTILETFCNALAAQIAASLKPNGTLTDGAINSTTQFSSLQLFADNFIASLSLPVSTNFLLNAYLVANPNVTASGYATGMQVQFKANFTNTLACTINYNGLGVQAIVKGVNQPLVAGDIQANQIVALVYDGTNFQMVGMLRNQASTTNFGPVMLANDADLANNTNPNNAVSVGNLKANRFVSSQFALPALSGNVGNTGHGFAVTPLHSEWYIICTDVGGDAGFVQNDVLDVAGLSNLTPENGVTFSWGHNATNVWLSVLNAGGNIQVSKKSDGSTVQINQSKWKAFCVAEEV